MTRARDLADSADKDITGTLTVDAISSSGDITLADNAKTIFGAGSDLQIYHNGTDSFIDENTSGWLYIRANDLVLGKYTGETYVKGEADGAVTLYHDNAVKIATTSTGVDVTGTVTADGLTVDGSFRQTGATAPFEWTVNAGATDYYKLNSVGYSDNIIVATAAGNVGIGTSLPSTALDVAGTVTADGDVKTKGQVRATGWAGSTSTDASGMGVEIGMSGGTGFMLVFDRNNSTYGNLKVNVNTSASIDPTAGGGSIVMNDNAHNTDFRVESSTKPYAIFVHGNTGQIGVDNNAPASFNSLGNSSQVVIGDGTATAGVTCFSNSGNGYGHLAFADSNTSGSTAQYAGLIQYTHSVNTMNFYTNANLHTVMQDGYITSRLTGNGHETVQYIRTNNSYTHVKTNIYRGSYMYYIKVVGAGGYAGQNTISLLTGYAYASNLGSTNSAYHGVTNLGNHAISDVYYSPDNYLCFIIQSAGYAQYTVTLASHASGYNTTGVNLIASTVGNSSSARYYA